MIKIDKSQINAPAILSRGNWGYRRKEVRKALEKVYHKKCCFCETPYIKGQVEHFRPKSLYPWLTNNWENLQWACHDCNNTKGAKFAITAQRANKKDPLSVYDDKEQPLLINPTKEHADQFIAFEKDGSLIALTERMQYTSDTCTLDRENLNLRRLSIINELKSLIASGNRFDDPQKTIAQIKELFIDPIKKDDELGFVAFRKYVVRHWLRNLLDQHIDKSNQKK